MWELRIKEVLLESASVFVVCPLYSYSGHFSNILAITLIDENEEPSPHVPLQRRVVGLEHHALDRVSSVGSWLIESTSCDE